MGVGLGAVRSPILVINSGFLLEIQVVSVDWIMSLGCRGDVWGERTNGRNQLRDYRKPVNGMVPYHGEGGQNRTDAESLEEEHPAAVEMGRGNHRCRRKVEAESRKRDRRKVWSACHRLPGGQLNEDLATWRPLGPLFSSSCPLPTSAASCSLFSRALGT